MVHTQGGYFICLGTGKKEKKKKKKKKKRIQARSIFAIL
jgi:hypothetical protein